MNFISRTTKLADIISKNESLIPVCTRLGIRLGVGDATVKDTCKANGVNIDLFLSIINILIYPHYEPTEKLQTFSVLQLTDYLKKENESFITEIKIIDNHVRALTCGNDNLTALQKMFREYADEILLFVRQKERVFFPSIIAAYENYYSPMANKHEKEPVYFPEHESEILNGKLNSIKTLIIKHIQGDYDEYMLYSVLVLLSRFEKQFFYQQQIENRLLKKIVAEMEARTKQMRRRRKNPERNTYISLPATNKEILSPREKEVLILVSKGYINKEIAEELQISLHTVISHRKNITRKLSIHTVSGLTAYAIQNGLISQING